LFPRNPPASKKPQFLGLIFCRGFCRPANKPGNSFDWEDAPLLRVQCGESFEIETYTRAPAISKPIDKRIPARRPGFEQHPPLVNPIGRTCVSGRGRPRGYDCRHDEDILVDDYSWTAMTGAGALWGIDPLAELSADYYPRFFAIYTGPSGTTREERCGSMSGSPGRSPPSSHLGSLRSAKSLAAATARENGEATWIFAMPAPGNRIFCRVSSGACFIGDVHASQGDTEFTGTAAETNRRSAPAWR